MYRLIIIKEYLRTEVLTNLLPNILHVWAIWYWATQQVLSHIQGSAINFFPKIVILKTNSYQNIIHNANSQTSSMFLRKMCLFHRTKITQFENVYLMKTVQLVLHFLGILDPKFDKKFGGNKFLQHLQHYQYVRVFFLAQSFILFQQYFKIIFFVNTVFNFMWTSKRFVRIFGLWKNRPNR